jgi:hypothetical protein
VVLSGGNIEPELRRELESVASAEWRPGV